MPHPTGQDQRERELKFDVPAGWELPDPAALCPAGGRIERADVHLETTYFDTAAHDLVRSRLTLRRRSGDADVGWQLKVPDGAARLEIRLSADGRRMPEPLRTATLGVRGRAGLSPIVVLTTDRVIHRLLDGEGTALAEIAIDSVSANGQRDLAVARNWREVEVELLDGDERVLDRAARWLTKQGAVPSTSPSKLARALDLRRTEPRDPTGLAGLVGLYLDRQHEAILRGDIDHRRGLATIHDLRVATRRYRSVLRVFGDILDPERRTALDAELRRFGTALGEVRDRQVLRKRLDALLAQLPTELVVGPVATRIRESLTAEQVQAEVELDALMRTRRYFALLAELRSWREQLPVTTDRPAGDTAHLVRKTERKVARRMAAAPEGADHDAAMHRARKAAKRARYAAELARPALGKHARASAKRSKKTQQRLGERQDGVLTAEFLRRAAMAAHAAGENAFTLGLLYERERSRAQDV